MHFYPNERIALFIDGANLYATAKSLGFDIDFKRLLALFCSKGQLVRALYYTALTEDQEYSSLRPLIGWLGCNGFTVVTSKSSRSSRICTATLAPLAAARARLANKAPISLVQQTRGHGSLKTTSIYAHAAFEVARAAILKREVITFSC